tara:strand:- start:1785 stop:2246 length:462 start_codon:yes stop_codon:yes gene_type:complete
MKKITIVGTGYVGLVTGVGLSEFGNKVICADIDKDKILQLKSGIIPIYEPGLEEIIKRNVKSKRLYFSDNISLSIQKSEVIIIAVGTPQTRTGDANMDYVDAVIKAVKQNLNDYKIICTKSTVPIGTGRRIIETLSNDFEEGFDFDYVSNPEF